MSVMSTLSPASVGDRIPTSSQGEHGVVSICSPVNTAFAPAKKHMACSFSDSVCRPAASRMIVDGSTILAVEMVRKSV